MIVPPGPAVEVSLGGIQQGRWMMRKKIGLAVLGLALAGGVSACANTYGIPPGGPHFASVTHLQYSTRGGEKPRLTKTELNQAKSEGWWGIATRYTIDELE